jgi:hypothetical protein
METFYLICIILVGLLIIFPLGTFFIRKYNINNHKQEIIRLRKFKGIDYYYIIFGFVLIAISILSEKNNENIGQFLFWLLLGIGHILTGVLNKGEYLLLSPEGIKRMSPEGIKLTRMLKWNIIKNTRLNEFNKTKIIIETKTKNIAINFYTVDKINELKRIVERLSPRTYELYFNEI